jgi:NTP pyrophosphatase (non-canonical NTP hydrolase)
MDQDWQQQVADFARKHNLLHDSMIHALDLVAEVGEVSKGILHTTNYVREPLSPSPEIEEELGDSLYSLLILAEACGVDAGRALKSALDKYEQRLQRHGDAGSRHEP